MPSRPKICALQISSCNWRVINNDKIDQNSVLGEIEYGGGKETPCSAYKLGRTDMYIFSPDTL